jgi:hypothetical protein
MLLYDLFSGLLLEDVISSELIVIKQGIVKSSIIFTQRANPTAGIVNKSRPEHGCRPDKNQQLSHAPVQH